MTTPDPYPAFRAAADQISAALAEFIPIIGKQYDDYRKAGIPAGMAEGLALQTQAALLDFFFRSVTKGATS